MFTASLPMYNIPEIRRATTSLWSGIARAMRREGLRGVPSRLVFDRPLHSLWGDPRLLFSQCCGYDVVARFKDVLTPVAVPHFDIAGCAGNEYSSLVVVRGDCPYDDVLEMYGTVAVINGPESHSGMNSLRQLVAPQHRDGRFFDSVLISGAHVVSLDMLRRGEADVAAIDCVTYQLLSTYQPRSLVGTRVLGQTYHSPAPPYVTRSAFGSDRVKRIRTALQSAFADPSLDMVRDVLFLKNVELIDSACYSKITEIEDFAAGLGYPVLQ